MNGVLQRERGQALILITLAAIGLFGITGLAVDGSAKFSDRRHAQNAADTAALTGALALVRGEIAYVSPTAQQWQYDALSIADENGYDRDFVTNQVWVYRCSDPATVAGTLRYGSPVDCGPYEGKSDYVQVVILSNVNTYFARVIGIRQTRNIVQAVALAKPPLTGSLFGGNAIVELKPFGRTNCSSGNGEFEVAGSGTVNIYGGGVLVNSNSACAFQQNGCNTRLNLYSGGQVNMVGGASLQASCPEKMPPPPWPIAEPYEWPPTEYELPPPPECAMTGYPAPVWDGAETTTIYPGNYTVLPPSGLRGSIVRMSPGNYCVTNVLKQVTSSSQLLGTDIFFYIKPGGSFTLQGGIVQLSANATDDTSIYKNYLIYVAPSPGYVDFSSSSTTCKINGSAVSTLTGGILAPYCNVEILGSSGSTGIQSQIIAYTVKLSGDNTLNFYYDATLNPIRTLPPKTGIMR